MLPTLREPRNTIIVADCNALTSKNFWVFRHFPYVLSINITWLIGDILGVIKPLENDLQIRKGPPNGGPFPLLAGGPSPSEDLSNGNGHRVSSPVVSEKQGFPTHLRHEKLLDGQMG